MLVVVARRPALRGLVGVAQELVVRAAQLQERELALHSRVHVGADLARAPEVMDGRRADHKKGIINAFRQRNLDTLV